MSLIFFMLERATSVSQLKEACWRREKKQFKSIFLVGDQ